MSQELRLPKEVSVAKKPEYVKPPWMEEMAWHYLHIGSFSYPASDPDLILEFALSLVPPVALNLTFFSVYYSARSSSSLVAAFLSMFQHLLYSQSASLTLCGVTDFPGKKLICGKESNYFAPCSRIFFFLVSACVPRCLSPSFFASQDWRVFLSLDHSVLLESQDTQTAALSKLLLSL